MYQRELVAKEEAFKGQHTSLMQLKHEKRHQVCLVESLTKSVETLQKELHDQKEKFLDKEAECTRLQRDLLEERNTAHFHQKAEYDVRVQMEGMQQKLSEVARLSWAVDSDTKQRNEKIKHLNGEVGRLRKQIEHLQITTRGASIKLKKSERSMSGLKETLVEKERRLVKALRQVEERSRELESTQDRTLHLVNAKRASHMKISALASEVDVKKRKILSLEETIIRMQGEAKKKQDEVEMLEQELRTLKQSLLEMKQPHAMELYVREINNLKRLLDHEKLKNVALGNEILKPKVRKKFNSFENSKSHLGTLLSKNARLQKELARKADALRKLESDMQSKTAEAETMRSQMIQQSGAVRDEKLWSIQKELESSRSRIKSLLGERSASESLCSKYEKEIAQLKQELKECKSQ